MSKFQMIESNVSNESICFWSNLMVRKELEEKPMKSNGSDINQQAHYDPAFG